MGTVPEAYLSCISSDGTQLSLSNMDLTKLPNWLADLTALTTLDVSGNRLTELPEWLGDLVSLANLNLNRNRLTVLPKSLSDLGALTYLDLGSNRLETLPESLSGLASLGRLNLSRNELVSLPESLGTLTSLTTLNLSNNDLAVLPESLGALTVLTALNVRDNELMALPESLWALTSLTNLNVSGNKLAALPEWRRGLPSLTYLDLKNNQLAALPEWLAALTALTYLDLGYNALSVLPEGLSGLTSLITLDLSYNGLEELPESLGALTALTTLNVSGNNLKELPESLGALTALNTLHLGHNKLVTLPSQLGGLTALKYVNLADNKLATLPAWLAGPLAGGATVELADNPLTDPLPELLARSPAALATYLASLADAEPQYEAKMLLVGEGNVGKSSLVASLRGDPFAEDRPTTHGIEISPVALAHPSNEIEMIVRAWDFGGQDVYRVTHQFFYTRRALYVVVWHAREGQEQNQVEDWLRRIRLRVGSEARAIVVATHCAERLPDLDYRYLKQSFPEMLAGSFAVDNRDGQGIVELRDAIAERAAQLPQMGQLLSPRWVRARDTIIARASNDPQISYEDFEADCAAEGLTGRETVILAELLHDLGHIIYYGDDDGLRDIVVLNPEWLTRAISYVLNDQPTRDTGGVLDHARLRQLWQEHRDGGGYPARYHPYFLRLMEKFDVSYRIDGDDQHSLVAQLVPHERSELPWQRDTPLPVGMRQLSLICELSEQAPGLIPWLTVRHHRASVHRHWRKGVFLRHPVAAYHSEALLELRHPQELVLDVRAPSPDLYFHTLLTSIEELIASRWPGLEYILSIPCPGQDTSRSRCPGRFPLEGLLGLRENGLASVPCMRCRHSYQISLLLTGFTAPDQPLSAEIEEQITRIERKIIRVEEAVTETAAVIRRVLRVVSTEVTDCPSLFSLAQDHPDAGRRLQVHRHHYRLMLWCEHPDHWHPWTQASYELDPPKDWFTAIAPYASLVIRILQLAVPLTGSIAVASQPAAQIEVASAHLETMKAIVEDLPQPRPWDYDEIGQRQATGKLTAAEGAALRALRALVFQLDPARDFGGLRRVQAPSGDLLWVCPDHYPEYDPGLPELP